MVTGTYTPDRYNTDGVQTEFDITFEFENEDQIHVWVRNKTTNTYDPMEKPADYTVDGSKIITTIIWPDGYELIIKRILEQKQNTDYIENDNLPANRVEWDFDKVVMMVQQHEEMLSRAALLNEVSQYSGIKLPDPEDGYSLIWDDGDLHNARQFGTGSYAIKAFMETFLESLNQGGAQSNLGISDYIKTLLDDPDAANARATLMPNGLDDILDGTTYGKVKLSELSNGRIKQIIDSDGDTRVYIDESNQVHIDIAGIGIVVVDDTELKVLGRIRSRQEGPALFLDDYNDNFVWKIEEAGHDLGFKSSLDAEETWNDHLILWDNGLVQIYGNLKGNEGVGNSLKVETDEGYIDIGPKNADFCHMYTDAPRFLFNKEVRVDSGHIGSFDEDLILRTSGTNRITISNSNGDVTIHYGKLKIDKHGDSLELEDASGIVHTFGDTDSGETHGIVLRTHSNPADGEPIFVVESAGDSQRLRVEHNGLLSTSNSIKTGVTYQSSDGSEGVTDAFITADSPQRTVGVKDGIITSIT